MNVSTKLFATTLLASALFSTANADSQVSPAQPSIKSYGCMVMEQKADGSMGVIHQAGFNWNPKVKVSESFHQEGKLMYFINSEANSGVMSLAIFNAETGTAAAAIGDMNKVMMVFDTNAKRIFGCGEGSAADMSSLTKSLSVK